MSFQCGTQVRVTGFGLRKVTKDPNSRVYHREVFYSDVGVVKTIFRDRTYLVEVEDRGAWLFCETQISPIF